MDSPPPATSAGFGTLAALLLFIAASVWLGALAQRVVERGSFLKGYFLGNRGLGAWALALTATVQSGGTFMGFPSLVYTYGWVVALWIGSYMIVPLTGFGVLGKRIAELSRRTGAITVPDLVRERFGSPSAGLLASLLIMFFMTIMMVAQFKAGALVMKISWPGSGALALAEDASDGYDYYYYLGLAVFSLTVVGYTLIGGFLAAVWTDLFQSVMMFVGVMILLPLVLSAAGGLETASRKLPHEIAAPPANRPNLADDLARRKAAEECLRRLDRAVREFADRHDGRLPESLNGLAAAGEAASSWNDPVTGRPITYEGRGLALEAAGSPRRTTVALTPPDEEGWQTVLYSNGLVRSGYRAGSLSTGPGPFDFHPLGMAVSFFFVWVFAGLGSPAGMVRIMASKKASTIRRSIALLAVYNMFIYLPLIVICICGRTLIPDLRVSDEIVPRLALFGTSDLWGGSFLAGLILAAPFGAIMSTVSTYLVVIASGVVHDVYQRFVNPRASERTIRWLSHVMMVVVGAVGVVSVIDPPHFLQAIVVFSGTCGATTFVAPALMTCFWRRATAAGAMAAMLAGVGTTLALYAAGWIVHGAFRPYTLGSFDPIIWGLAASHLAGVAVSLGTAPPPTELVARLFDAPAATGFSGGKP